MRGFLVSLAMLVVLPVAAQDSDQYQSIVAEAVAENAAGRYPEALALFRRAHEINANARTLRAMGAVSYEVRQYVDSVRWLEAALIDRRQPLTDEQRSEVQELLERAYRFVGRYAVEVEGSLDFVVRVDGEEASTPLILGIGEHAVQVAAGDVERRDDVRVLGGENETLRFDVRPGSESGRLPDPVTEPVDGPSHVLSSISFGVAGLGVGLFAIGGGLGTAKRNDLDDMMCADTPGGCPDGEVDTLETHARIANAGIAIAAIGLTAGLIFRFVLEREPEVSASASREGASVSWRRRF